MGNFLTNNKNEILPLLPALLPSQLNNNHSLITESKSCHLLVMPRKSSTLDLIHHAHHTCPDTHARTGGKVRLPVSKDKPADSEITYHPPNLMSEMIEKKNVRLYVSYD